MLNTISSFTNTKSRFYHELKKKEVENQLLQLGLMENIIVSLTSLNEVSNIYFAGLVHDIGKTVIPHNIINKKGKLTQSEFELVKKHSYFGHEALSKKDAIIELKRCAGTQFDENIVDVFIREIK